MSDESASLSTPASTREIHRPDELYLDLDSMSGDSLPPSSDESENEDYDVAGPPGSPPWGTGSPIYQVYSDDEVESEESEVTVNWPPFATFADESDE